MTSKIYFGLIALGLLGAGCSHSPLAPAPPAPSAPDAFLKWSMDRYAEMPTYESKGTVSMTSTVDPSGPAAKPVQSRTFEYLKPNRFKVVSNGPQQLIRTTVCDGSRLVEYSNSPQEQPASYGSPDGILTAASMHMEQPTLCGTLLYQFFGGSANYGHLVDTNQGAVTFGSEETIGQEPCHIVKFYGQQKYGHVEAAIGEKTGHVYRITYDLEPVLKNVSHKQVSTMLASLSKAVPKFPPGADRDRASQVLRQLTTKGTLVGLMTASESFSDIRSPAEIGSNDFDATLPFVQTPQTAGDSGPASPVPLGSPAPDFEVQTLDGRKVKLSSFRGRPVMLDFWATWCPPCREGLPETNRISQKGAGQGLEVMAISSETPSTISKFMKQNSYSVKAYQDVGGSAESAFKVDAIPVVAMIDAKGNLRAYLMGLRPPEEISAELAKMGVKGL